MDTTRLLIVTGASGAGKTTITQALAARRLDGVGCYHADDTGVPSEAEMAAQHGSPEGWQRATLDAWVRHLVANPDGVRLAVLDAQVRPSDARDALERHGAVGRVLVVDCGYVERDARLAKRGQPDLASARMDQWAAYLKGQADALGLAVLDTAGRSVPEATDALEAEARALLEG